MAPCAKRVALFLMRFFFKSVTSAVEAQIRRLPRHFVVAFGIVVLLFSLDITQIINLREKDAYDFRMRVRPMEKAHRNIVILAIDDLSLQALGPWPWRRSVHAELIRALNAAGTKAIFFDILFPERSQNPEDDLVFSEAIREAGNVVLPFHYTSRNPFDPLYPLPEFLSGARETGYANVEIDHADGVVRHVLPFAKMGGHFYYHSSVAVFLSLFDRLEEKQAWVKDFSRRFPQGELLVNYPGGMDMFQKFSVGEVFERTKTEEGRQFLRQIFQGKIVLLGHIATGTSDLRTTPVQPMMPGIVIQASVLNMLLTDEFLISTPVILNFTLAFFLAWIIAFCGQRLKPQWSFAWTIAQMVLFMLMNCLVFNYFRVVIQLPMPMVAMFTVFIVSLFLKYVDVRVESDFLERELQMASKIQQSLLPGTELKLPQLDAGFRCLFFEQVGGDLYDWMDLGNGRVALCLGDVSGKGVPAALYMSRALNELRHQVTSGDSPGEILTELNNHLSRGETSGMFLTLFFMIIDSNTKKIYFTNGGHDPMVYYHAKNNKADLISSAGGLPIGIMEDQTYETGGIEFGAGDVMLLTSDGIKEQKSPRGEQYGSERLQQILERCAKEEDAGKMIDAVMADVLGFASGRPPHDDRTLVCVKILGS